MQTLKPKDFSDASDNIEIVLTSIIGCLADLYKNGKEFDPDKKQNIFDVVSGGLLGSDDPPPIIAVIEASTKVSELIANIGKGIKDMSTMMIPNAWNDKGQPTHYVKLTKEDFTGAANSVADIITCLIKALSSESTMGVLKSMNLKNTLEAMLPASELISGIADGIIKLASGQVPSKWDPKTGKPIEYKKITIEDYIAAGVVITEIMTYMVRTLQDVVYGTNNGQSSLISIFKDDTFKDIVDSISTIGGLISDIADSVIKMGQGLIPNKWDKDGKVIGYTPINFDTATKNLKSVVSEILMVTVDSLIEAYNGKDGKTGIKDIIGDSDNSPFMIAVQGITQIMQTVSSITDSVVKLGQAQIPIIWDKNGKPIWWKEINVSETIKNIEKIFNGDGTTSGIFSILCKSILDVHKEYFKEGNENNLTEVIPNVTNGIEQIVKTVSNTADLLVKIGSLALPTGFDKDGKPKNMHIVNDKDITKAKENITNILTSLLSIFDKDIKDNQLNKYLNGKIIDQTIINDNMMNVGGIIDTLIQQVKTITTFKEVIVELYKYNAKTPKNNIQVDLIRDIYTILDSFISLSNKVIENKDKFKGTKEEYNLIDKNLGYITDLSSSTIIYVAEVSNSIKSIGINELIKFIRKDDKNSINNLISNILTIYTDIYSKLFTSQNGLLTNINNESFISLKTNLRTLNNIILLMIRSIDKNIEAFKEINNLNIYINKDSKSYIPDIINKILSTYLAIDNIIFASTLNYERDNKHIKNIQNNISAINYIALDLVSKIQNLIEIINFKNIVEINKYITESTIENRLQNILNIFNNIGNSILDNNLYIDLKKDSKDYNLVFYNLTNNIDSIHEFISNLIINYHLIKHLIETITDSIDIENIKNIITFYSESLNLLNNVYTASINSSLMNSNSQNLLMINSQIMQISSTLSLMFMNMGIIYNAFYTNVNKFKENIDTIIGQLDMSGSSLYTSIEALKINLDAMRNIYKTDFADIKFNDESNVIHNISNDLQYFVNNAINPFDQEMFSKFNNLNTSIDTIYKTISKQKNSTKDFKINTNELGNYIKVINSVQLNKLRPLTTLVQELNKLANKLGGLDKLTEHLSGELAVVLKELVDALTDSKTTIEDAHRLQSNRHDQINKSIATIKGLLNMPLNVNVQATGNNMLETPGGADATDPVSQTTNNRQGQLSSSNYEDSNIVRGNNPQSSEKPSRNCS